ncbi:MAG: ABC transporter ATP-binding protein/permease [Oscillospiraceae bacterium]|jgi:ATP-binding cassette subfamily B protein|nr:ABC transporter ATP-binding protein/permease [Oscillospiraceae bacterium]
MKIVFRYLKPFLPAVLLCIVLLFGQAMGELTLPNLMSDIVNVGLQGGGISESVPRALSPQAMEFLTTLMSPEDEAVFRRAYKQVAPGEGGAEAATFPKLEETGGYVLALPEKERHPDVSASYDRASSFFLTKAIALMKAAQEKAGAAGSAASAEEFSASSGFDNREPAEIYGMGLLLRMDPTLPEQIQAADGGGDASMFGRQVGTAMIKLFYRDLGADTSKIQSKYIYRTGAQMLLLALGCGLAAVSVSFLAARTSAGLSRNMRRSIFEKVQRFSKKEIDRFSTASLITRSTNDVQQVQMIVLMGIRMIVFSPVMGVGGLVMALRKSPSLSWIIGMALAALVALLLFALLVVMPRFRSLQKLIDRLNLVSRENLTGLMVIRAFGNERHEEERVEGAARSLRDTERFLFRAMSVMMPLLMLLMNVLSMLVIWFGGHAIAESQIQIGDMMAFLQYAMHVVMSFLFVAMIFVMLPRAAVSANRIKEVLDTPEGINDPEQPESLPEGPCDVTFDHVDFRYGGAEEDVLQDITFRAPPGQITAFIGATGAGKSTLVNLLERFYDVTGGSVQVGGVDVRRLPQAELRRTIGFVPQQAVLFSGDIRSNVSYGAGSATTDETIRQAIAVAQAEDFVSGAPGGLEAPIAQGGANVSGGQKQRLSIARALARKPRIYVFDDSFSALDFKTDAALRRALGSYTDGATVLIVAQRVSTIMTADQIVVLDEGRVVGIGPHKQLLQSCGVYREIAESQLSKEELA